MKTPDIAIAVAALLAGSTAAMANERESVSLKVDAASVDFANPAQIAAFRRAAERQIAAACNPGDRLNADLKPDFKCRKEMAASLEPTVQRLAMRATERRWATTD